MSQCRYPVSSGLLSPVSGLGNGDSLLYDVLRHNCNLLGGAECLLNLKVSILWYQWQWCCDAPLHQAAVVIKTWLWLLEATVHNNDQASSRLGLVSGIYIISDLHIPKLVLVINLNRAPCHGTVQWCKLLFSRDDGHRLVVVLVSGRRLRNVNGWIIHNYIRELFLTVQYKQILSQLVPFCYETPQPRFLASLVLSGLQWVAGVRLPWPCQTPLAGLGSAARGCNQARGQNYCER